MFFIDSILFRWISVISFKFCATLLWLLMQHILKAIWKSWHRLLGISIDTAKFYFFLINFFWKIKHDQYNSCANLFGTSITLLQLLIYLWSSFNPSRGNKKGCLIFWSTHSLPFRKNSCSENFAKLSQNTSILASLIEVHLQAF